ncbi:uncharacterized protein MELLADRAFT_60455 [Melampsora larici-populina 98AG31]|uniref:Uncharacterized protein n=1 Tax=Melampsora larici-populina (strain 98AG31 / pathotype 3-4-7) TaxID=747676 RepID=F4RB83_MELLP|nr:uncharacterized protein MELLADRAFT_60455 [Melampsora larici-populina 98AG31]EGG10036.1 hypothetical protein MELLADRAFT_60455 [Melampsora larici-populina 98AG31]
MRLNGINQQTQDSNEVLISSHLMKSSKAIQDHSPGLSAWLLNKSIDINPIETSKEEEEDENRKRKRKCEECGLDRLKYTWIGKQMRLWIVCDYCGDRNWKSMTKKSKQQTKITTTTTTTINTYQETTNQETANQVTIGTAAGTGNENANGEAKGEAKGNREPIVELKTLTEATPNRNRKPKTKKNSKNSQLTQILKLHQSQSSSSSSSPNQFNLNQFLTQL